MSKETPITLAGAALALITMMAGDDLREPNNFVTWLIFREAQRRGLLPDDTTAADPRSSDSATGPEASGHHEV